MNMRTNCRKNSSRSGSAPPTNPANLLGKGRIKYGVTGSVRVRVRYRVKVRVTIYFKIIRLIFDRFIDLCSLDGATELFDRHENSGYALYHTTVVRIALALV